MSDLKSITGQKFASTITRRSLVAGAASASAAILATSSRVLGAPSTRYNNRTILLQDKAELLFTYWGSPQEQEAVKNMVDDFNSKHDNITVKPQYISNTGYDEKVTTMLAGGNPPDIAYMGSGLAWKWAQDGQTLDLKQYVDADKETSTLLPNTTYTFDNGKVMSTSLAISNILMYYNKKLFADAGVDAPPVTGETAWTWDQFVEVAKKLTKDSSGKTPNDSGFDPGKISTYGVSYGQWWLEPVWSAGGNVASEDGKTFTLNSPQAVDAFQKLQDLIYVHHVAPTPAASTSLPATDILMRTGKLAMDINGMWKVLDYSHSKNLEWGMGVSPIIKTPITRLFGIPIIVSAKVKNPDAAYEFYRWRYSPERIDLYAKGLWMPLPKAYYTEPDKIKEWIDPAKGVFPEEAHQVLIDYSLKYSPKQLPDYWLKNQEQINTEAINPALTSLWANEGTAQKLLDQAAAKAAPLMQGRY